ncbi:MAG: alpha-glucosidase C-terminal domain-containing protein [Muribaculaceae bacterium]|nr:alpha-glucosidase C-terminal domain-containing protein [Muribaculaceae bacterium]
MRRLFYVSIMMMVALCSTAAVYEPALTSDDEVCVFFEANGTVADAPCIWVWAGNTDGRNYVGTAWPGAAMTYMGDTPGGNKIYKWTYTGTLAMPTGLIYTWNSQGGRVDGTFTNHGYYVMGQLTRIVGAGESTFVPNQHVIYQLDLYNFTSQGTLAAAQERLDYLKDLGIDIIWLMPIHPRGVQGRIGSLGSPYAPRDYHAVNSDFGTIADLRAFVAAAHERGMQVWLDWVANHTAKDNVWITQHRDYYNSTLTSPNGYGDVYQLDYSKEATQLAMIEAMQYWIDQADIDGYRCDYISSNTIPTAFWTRAIKALKEYKPGKTITMLGEGDMASSVSRLLVCGWDYDYAWGFQSGLVNNKSNPSGVLSQCRNLVGDLRFTDVSRMVYLTNHDQNYNSSMTTQYGNNAYAFTVLTFTLYGMPLLYNGQETGYLMSHKLDYFNRTPINWNSVDSKMQHTVKALTALKHSCDALIDNADRASEVTFLTTGNNNVVAYTRHHNEQTALVVLNLGASTVNTVVTGLEAGEWKLAIDVDNIAAGLTATPVTLNATQSFSIPAGGYKVYYKGEPAPQWLVGDVNGDGEVNIADVTRIIDVILGGEADAALLARADVNGDGEVNIGDVTKTIDLILEG